MGYKTVCCTVVYLSLVDLIATLGHLDNQFRRK